MSAESVMQVDLSLINTPKRRIDLGSDDVKKLVASMDSSDGQLQPIMLKEDGKGRYNLVFGHRRLAAAQHLEWEHIQAKITNIPDDEIPFVQIAENAFRSIAKNKPAYLQIVKKWYDHYLSKVNGKSDKQLAAEEKKRNEEGVFSGTAKEENEQSPLDQAGEASTTDRLAVVERVSVEDENEAEETQEAAPRQAFYKQVAQATGASERSAYRDAAMAKAFSDGDLIALNMAEATQADMLRLAAIKDDRVRSEAVGNFGMGLSLDDAIRQAEEDAGTSQPAIVNTKDMSDEQWLDHCCSDIRSLLDDPTEFDRDAIAWRAATRHLTTMKTKIGSIIRDAKRKKSHGEFLRSLERVFLAKHPRDWIMCSPCRGSGLDPDDASQKCPKCFGRGYKMTFDSEVR